MYITDTVLASILLFISMIYDNYMTAGFGNFSTPQVEVFAHGSSTRFNEFGGFFNYHSSIGGVEGTVLDDNFLDTRLDLFYKQDEDDFDWQGLPRMLSRF